MKDPSLEVPYFITIKNNNAIEVFPTILTGTYKLKVVGKAYQ
jgi:hypothetical protein